jgi:hypothetical protein
MHRKFSQKNYDARTYAAKKEAGGPSTEAKAKQAENSRNYRARKKDEEKNPKPFRLDDIEF